MSNLILHCGADRVEKADLRNITTPQGTKTWTPVSHHQVAELVTNEAKNRGYEISSEEYGLNSSGSKMFGVLRFHPDGHPEWSKSLGIRNSNDKTFSLGLTVGLRVMVCDNLCFSGDELTVARRHTSHMDIEELIPRTFDQLTHHYITLERNVEELKITRVSIDQAKLKIVRAAQIGAIRPSDILPVIDEFENPAFPLGMMNEIVRARYALSAYGEPDPERKPYNFKRQCIQDCIYGVDIDSGAIDIAKLRLWLSLIVDEDDFATIQPLPNLDYKIMQGNSLLESYEGIELFDERIIDKDIPNSLEQEKDDLLNRQREIQKEYITLHSKEQLDENKKALFDIELNQIVKRLKRLSSPNKAKEVEDDDALGLFDKSQSKKYSEKLKILHSQFFDETSKNKKTLLRQQISELEWKLIEATLKEHDKSDSLMKLSTIRKSNTRPFFLWKLYFSEVFKENGGFDVVIANPPYIGEKANSELFSKLKQKPKWKSFYRRRSNTYYFFIKQGIDIKTSNGCLIYIVPREFLTADWANNLRAYILQKTNIGKIIDFNQQKVFDAAGTSSMILLLTKLTESENAFEVLSPVKTDYIHEVLCMDDDSFEKHTFHKNGLDSSGIKLWIFSKDCISGKKQLSRLGDVCNVSQGIVTGADKVTKKHVESGYISENYIGRGIFILTENTDIKIENDEDVFLNLGGKWLPVAESEKPFIRPYITSNNLSEWHIDKTDQWMIYLAGGKIEKGVVYDYLKQFKMILINRSKIDDNVLVDTSTFDNMSRKDIENIYSSAGAVQKVMKKKLWFLPLYERVDLDFSEPKIIVNTKNMFPFSYSDKCHMSSGGGLGGQNYIFLNTRGSSDYIKHIEDKSSRSDYVKYINATLNSSIVKHEIAKGNYNQLSTSKIKDIRIYKIDLNNSKERKLYDEIVQNTNKIIEQYTPSDSDLSKSFEREISSINRALYKLYGLDENGISIIEGKK